MRLKKILYEVSNRDKHFNYAFLCSIPVIICLAFYTNIVYGLDKVIANFFTTSISTILAFTLLGTGLEFKDKLYGNKFDYIDIVSTVLGVIPNLFLLLICTLICYFI